MAIKQSQTSNTTHTWTEGVPRTFSVLVQAIYVHAAAAKSLQLCLTLCDPIDNSPPGSAIPGILQARILTSKPAFPFRKCLTGLCGTGTTLSSQRIWNYFFFFLSFYFYFILLYNTVLVLPYIDMNPPRVYMQSQT